MWQKMKSGNLTGNGESNAKGEGKINSTKGVWKCQSKRNILFYKYK